ncbi:HEAT repeat domain-containing protein [Lignipirellula cremea]|uniref:Putative lyase n=1 Tax=Lignipirellula cremea TaxID=2528010 RepID=A0A518E1N5_9BACT|nr:HEAT repeat domain-containing protein [Lignipirellula cremea]QDU97984.1 putative lyase [Lignipirellula cremea]
MSRNWLYVLAALCSVAMVSRPSTAQEPAPVSEASAEKGFATPSGEPDLEGPIDPQTSQILENYYREENAPLVLGLLKHRNPTVRIKAATCVRYNDDLQPKAVAPLSALLRDPTPAVRMAAVEALGSLGEHTLPALPALTAALDDPAEDVAHQAAYGIGNLGEKALPALPALLNKLDNEEIRDHVIRAIGLIGLPAKEAAPKILPYLYKNDSYNSSAGEALARLGVWEPQLKYLGGYRNSTIYNNLRYLRPTNDTVVDVLIKGLKEESKYTRDSAISSLGEAHPTTEKIVSALASMLESTEPYDRRNAAVAMKNLDPLLKSAAPPLLKAAADEDEGVRDQALEALAKFSFTDKPFLVSVLTAFVDADGNTWNLHHSVGEAANDVFPILVEVIQDPKSDLKARVVAVEWLQHFDGDFDDKVNEVTFAILDQPDAPAPLQAFAAGVVYSNYEQHLRLVDAIVLGLKQTDMPRARRFAARYAERTQSAAVDPWLIAALADEDPTVVEAVASVIGSKKLVAALPALTRIAAQNEHEAHVDAISALGQLEAAAAPAVPTLMGALKYDSWSGPSAAATALGKIVPLSEIDAKPIVKELTAMLDDENNSTRVAAAETIAKMPAEAALLGLDRLITELDGENAYYVGSIAEAIGAIGPPANKAAPKMIALLEQSLTDKNKSSMQAALLKALPAVKADAAAAAPLIASLLTQESEYDRRRVLISLGQFGPAATGQVAAVSKLLEASSSDERAVAAETLGLFASRDALPALVKLAEEDPDEDVRETGLKAVLAIDPKHAVIEKLLIAGLAEPYSHSWNMVREMKDKGIPLLTVAMKSEDAKIREGAMQLLNYLTNPKAKAAAFQVALEDKDPDVQFQGAYGLLQLRLYSDKILPVLLAAFVADEENDREYELQNSLRQLGAPALRGLGKLAADENEKVEVRIKALRLVDDFYEHQGVIAPVLRQLVANPNAEIAGWAAVVLTQIDTDTRLSEPVFQAAQNVDSPELRATAIGRLSSYNTEENDPRLERAKQVLLAALSDEDESVSQQAAYQISNFELTALDEQRLIPMLSNKKTHVAVLNLLSSMSPPPAAAAPLLLASLSSDDENERELATRALSRFGAEIAGPVSALAADKKADRTTRIAAMECMSEIESPPRETLRPLAQMCLHEKGDLRTRAAITLAHQGVAHSQVFKALIEARPGDDWSLRYGIRNAWSRLEEKAAPAVPMVLAQLKAANPGEDKRAVIEILQSIGKDSPAAANAVVQTMIDEADENSQHYAYYVSSFGKLALPQLTAALASDQPPVVLSVLSTLNEMGDDAASALPKVTPLLDSKNEEIALAAAIAVASIGDDPKVALPVLLRHLDTESYAVFQSLSSLGEDAAPAVDQLIALLDNENVADSAMMVLGSIGPAAAKAAPRLVELMETSNDWESPVRVLTQIEQGGAAVPALVAMLDNPLRFESAIGMLSSMGEEGQAAVPKLTALLDNEDYQTRAIEGLARLGKVDPPVVARLLRLLDETTEEETQIAVINALAYAEDFPLEKMIALAKEGPERVRAAALMSFEDSTPIGALPTIIAIARENSRVSGIALRLIGSYGENVTDEGVQAIIAALDKPDMICAAAGALERLGPAAKAAIAKLRELLAKEEDDQRCHAYIDALAAIGPAAAEAAPELERFLKHKNESIRESAERAMWSIAPDRARELGLENADDE